MKSIKEKRYYWVYILECENGSMYTGSTGNLVKRYFEHITGKAAKYTRAFKPVSIAQCWMVYREKGMALKVEYLIKGFDRKSKERLVEKPNGLASLVNLKLNDRVDIVVFNPRLVEEKVKELGEGALKLKVDPFAD